MPLWSFFVRRQPAKRNGSFYYAANRYYYRKRERPPAYIMCQCAIRTNSPRLHKLLFITSKRERERDVQFSLVQFRFDISYFYFMNSRYLKRRFILSFYWPLRKLWASLKSMFETRLSRSIIVTSVRAGKLHCSTFSGVSAIDTANTSTSMAKIVPLCKIVIRIKPLRLSLWRRLVNFSLSAFFFLTTNYSAFYQLTM